MSDAQSGGTMSNKPSPSALRILMAFMLAAPVTMIDGAVWMIATDQGAPAFVAVGGSMLAAFATILASQIKKTS